MNFRKTFYKQICIGCKNMKFQHMWQLQLIVRYKKKLVFVNLNKIGPDIFLNYSFVNNSCNHGGMDQCNDCIIIAHIIQVLYNKKILQMDEFPGKSCFEITKSDGWKDRGIQLEGLKIVKERGHILFKTLTLFFIYLGRYKKRPGKIGETLTEATI